MTLLEKVKANLILDHSVDDELLEMYITAATRYAESYQHLPENTTWKPLCPSPHSKPSSCCHLTSMNHEMAALVVFTQIMFRLDSKYGIQSIFYCGLIEIGRCSYELWKNEYLYRYCREDKH